MLISDLTPEERELAFLFAVLDAIQKKDAFDSAMRSMETEGTNRKNFTVFLGDFVKYKEANDLLNYLVKYMKDHGETIPDVPV